MPPWATPAACSASTWSRDWVRNAGITRSRYQTEDMITGYQLLHRVAALINARAIKTTIGEHYGSINASNLRRAHALIESGKAKGKIVLEGA